MTELLPYLFLSLALAYVSEQNSIYRYKRIDQRECIKRDYVVYIAIALLLGIYAGLRTRYNDTTTYRGIYESMSPSISEFLQKEWDIGANPGFNLFNTWLRSHDVSAQSYLMIYSVVTIFIYIWFMRKYSENFAFTIYLFFAMSAYSFVFAAIKQTVAVAFCLVAVDRAIRKKWPSFIFWILFATLFHPYAIMYAITPFLMFSPWSKKTYYLIFGTLGICVSMQALMGSIIDVTSMIGEEYDSASLFEGAGVNILRLLVIWAPVIVSFFIREQLSKSESREMNIIVNLSMINAEIMLMARFGTALYWARLANYFLLFQTMMIPCILKYFNKKNRNMLTAAMVVCYFAYFVYAEGIQFGGFDMLHSGISLFDYFKIIFGV